MNINKIQIIFNLTCSYIVKSNSKSENSRPPLATRRCAGKHCEREFHINNNSKTLKLAISKRSSYILAAFWLFFFFFLYENRMCSPARRLTNLTKRKDNKIIIKYIN